MTAFFSDCRLARQRKINASACEYLVDRADCVEHLGKSDEWSSEVHGFTQFFRSHPDIQSRGRMGLKLRQRLHRGECDACDHFPLLQGKVPSREHFPEDEFLENGHHFRICAFSCKRFPSEKGPVVFFTDICPVHFYIILCRHGIGRQQAGQHDCYCLFHCCSLYAMQSYGGIMFRHVTLLLIM